MPSNQAGGKYQEIPACGTAIAGDMYNDHPKDMFALNGFLIEINMEMSDKEILYKLVHYLENEESRQELIQKGLEYCKDFTHEKYAERFVTVLENFIRGAE